jgi:hypothetical protein
MVAPLKVRVSVQPAHWPLVDAMNGLSVDIGSVSVVALARLMENPELLPGDLDPNVRLLCFGAPDPHELTRLLGELADELRRMGSGPLGRIVLVGGPLGTAMCAFLDVPTLAS